MRHVTRLRWFTAAALCVAVLAFMWRAQTRAPVQGRWIRTYPLLTPVGDDQDENAGAYPVGAEILGAPMPNTRLLEFRDDGTLYALIRERSSQKIFIADTLAYAMPAEGTLRLDGTCWKGWERHACSATYAMTVSARELQIESWTYRPVDPMDSSEAGIAERLPSPAPSATPVSPP